MFHWYERSAVCYAFLRHVPDPSDADELEASFGNCRWFTRKRGWKLQELLALKEFILYSKRWNHLGSKVELAHLISSVTSISKQYLLGEDLKLVRVAQKMS